MKPETIIKIYKKKGLNEFDKLLALYVLALQEQGKTVPEINEFKVPVALILQSLSRLDDEQLVSFKGNTFRILFDEETFVIKERNNSLAESFKNRLKSDDYGSNPAVTLLNQFRELLGRFLRKRPPTDNLSYSTFRYLVKKFTAKFVESKFEPFFKHEAAKYKRIRVTDFRDYVMKHRDEFKDHRKGWETSSP